LAEGAGAAALAALTAHLGRFAGQRVAIVCTGGNADPAELASLTA
jgi:threonine dehydratase